MKRFILFFQLCIFLGPSIAFAEVIEGPPVFLQPGEQRILIYPRLLRYSLSQEGVRVRRVRKEFPVSQRGKFHEMLILKAVKVGASELQVWKEEGIVESRKILIRKTSSPGVISSVVQAAEKLKEVEVYWVGASITLRGEVLSVAEAARIEALLRQFSTLVSDQTTLSESLFIQAERMLRDWLKKTHYDSRLRVEELGGELWIRGALSSLAEQKAVEKKARSIFPLIQFEVDSMPDRANTVHFKVMLLELKKSGFREFGIAWPAGQENAFQVSSLGVRDGLQLQLALRALEGRGSARMLSQPELVVRVPGEAEFFAGGELPLVRRTQYSSEVGWKKHGLTLKLKVTHSAGDLVRLEVFTEVSHLDLKIQSEGIPGIQASRMKTQVDARYGKPLFLSGLLQQGWREQIQGLPLLKDIPILGKLFGSEDYLHEKSELVAILIPSSLPPDPASQRFKGILSEAESPRAEESPSDGIALDPTIPWMER